MKFLEVLAFIFSLYTMLIVVDIILKWIYTGPKGRGTRMISQLTDPFLNFFRRLRISRIGYIDLSPLLAVLTLSIINQILGRVRELGSITFWAVIAIIISSIWNVIMTLLFAVLVVAIIRYLFLMFTTNKMNSFANACDAFFIPLSSRIASVFIKNSSSSYQLNLIISIIVVTVILTVGSFGITYLTNLLMGM
ncbi:MAG: YggT family protein [Spirochaetia bacterium]|nr:YggT family protein [Spirochaetia bacterium]MBO7093511.1 YggT family protein [Spirochaetia bacterium]MBO7517458.1 YggT family protein [Spirochaetia bacterium]MBP5740094.1 YggT family protein [Spirochaetia bacterium]